MALCVLPYGVQNESFTEQHFNLMVAPVLRRKGLQEHNDALIERSFSI